MPVESSPGRLTFIERLNFLVTNRLPRRWLTLLMGRFSKIENPFVSRASIAIWRLFADDLRLFEARKQAFSSMHDCFTRELKEGVRPIDSRRHTLVSPCDAVIGAFGEVRGLEVIQAKGFPYSIEELLGDGRLTEYCRDGRFVTLRLKSSMYHRFHAPEDGRIESVHYISGDTWNVNPVAIRVVERLYCRNERAVLPFDTALGERITLVAVAAILVASIRIHGLSESLNLEYAGANALGLGRRYAKGEEIGYFEHGSTIVLFAPQSFRFDSDVASGNVIRMGEPLMHRVATAQSGLNVTDTQT